MKNKFLVIIILFFGGANTVMAQRGCCSWHGGVSRCSSDGRIICNDGTYSPSCTCTPTYKYGCTDPNAINYNSYANKDDGSCIQKKEGCTNNEAMNYDETANVADGSCKFLIIEITEQEIPYAIMEENGTKNEIKQKGVVGKEEITTEIITDESGNIISKEITKRTVLKEPINEIKIISNNEETIDNKEDDNSSIPGILTIGVVGYLIYRKKNKKKLSIT